MKLKIQGFLACVSTQSVRRLQNSRYGQIDGEEISGYRIVTDEAKDTGLFGLRKHAKRASLAEQTLWLN